VCPKGFRKELNVMSAKTLTPAAPLRSPYSIDPNDLHIRAADLPMMTSVRISELFPDLDSPIETDCESVRKATIKALENMDLSKVKPGDSVNILASHHGFTLAGGEPYAEVLRSIRDEVERRTGTTDIRLRAGNGLRYRESEVFIKKFKLDEYFKGKAKNVTPLSRGIEIETELGPLYGIYDIYDAKWIIHVHNTDVRELHFHRVIDRIMKPFGMSYARVETRSTYHYNLGPRGGNFVARAICNSKFVQEKLLGAVMLEVSPRGITGVDADNDLLRLNERSTIKLLKNYGKLIILLNEVEEEGCIAILDAHAPLSYVSAGGLIFAGFLQIGIDPFDLDNPVTPYSFYTEQCYDEEGHTNIVELPRVSKGIKAMINNYSCKGYPAGFFSAQVPSVIVGEKLKAIFDLDEQNTNYTSESLIAPDLETAVDLVTRISGCKNIIVFDGAVGGINVSENLRQLFIKNAPKVSKKVDEELLPKWTKQRGINIK
jgi:hypothetical protein